jgi:hypothetical protein
LISCTEKEENEGEEKREKKSYFYGVKFASL